MDNSHAKRKRIKKRNISTASGPPVIIGPSKTETILTAIATNMAISGVQATARTMAGSDNPIISGTGRALDAWLSGQGEQAPDGPHAPALPSGDGAGGPSNIPAEIEDDRAANPGPGRMQGQPRDIGVVMATVAATYLVRKAKRALFGRRQPEETVCVPNTVRVPREGQGPLGDQGEMIDLSSQPGLSSIATNTDATMSGGQSTAIRDPFPSAPPHPRETGLSDPGLADPGLPDPGISPATLPGLDPRVSEGFSARASLGLETAQTIDTSALGRFRGTTLHFDAGSTGDPITIYPPAWVDMVHENGSAFEEALVFKVEPADHFSVFVDGLPGSNLIWRTCFSVLTNLYITPLIYKGGHYIFRNLGKAVECVFKINGSPSELNTITNTAGVDNSIVPEVVPEVVPDEVISPSTMFEDKINSIEEIGNRISEGTYTDSELQLLLAKIMAKLNKEKDIVIWSLPAAWVATGKKVLLVVVYTCGTVLVIMVTVGMIYYAIKFYKRLDGNLNGSPPADYKEGGGEKKGPFFNGKLI